MAAAIETVVGTPAQRAAPQSGWGIASWVLLVMWLQGACYLGIFADASVRATGYLADSFVEWSVFFGVVQLAQSVLAFVCATIGMVQRNRRRFVPALALLFSAGAALVSALFFIAQVMLMP